jgi:hypothetical protein
VVDHLPREPARPRARPGQVLNRRLLLVGLIAVSLVAMARALGVTDLVRLDNVARRRECTQLVALSLLPRWLRGRRAALDDLLQTG